MQVLRVLHGGKELLEVLEDLQKMVVAGQIETLAVSYCTTDDEMLTSWAVKADCAYPWLKLTTGSLLLHNELLNEGEGI